MTNEQFEQRVQKVLAKLAPENVSYVAWEANAGAPPVCTARWYREDWARWRASQRVQAEAVRRYRDGERAPVTAPEAVPVLEVERCPFTADLFNDAR